MRPDATGDLRVMLDSVTRIAAGLDSWMSGQQQARRAFRLPQGRGKGLTRTLEDPRLSAAHISALDRSDPRVKPWPTCWTCGPRCRAWSVPSWRGSSTPWPRLDTNGARTRFRIALARLHTTITRCSPSSLIDGVGDPQYSAQAIPDLIESLRDGIAEMERQAQAHSALAAQAVAYIGEASRMMTIPNQAPHAVDRIGRVERPGACPPPPQSLPVRLRRGGVRGPSPGREPMTLPPAARPLMSPTTSRSLRRP